MTLQPVAITSEMLAGAYGSTPTVQITFELWVDSGHRAGLVDLGVDLIAGATITSLIYDENILAATPSTDPDFALRRYTFTQTNQTKTPTWTTVIANLDGAGATWTVSESREAVFELVSPGVNELIPALVSTLSSPRPLQTSGGLGISKDVAPYKFKHNGAALFAITSGNSIYHEVRWNTLRLTLNDPTSTLTASKITARRYSTLGAAINNLETNTPASVVLGPVNAGYRFVDITFDDHLFTGSGSPVIVVDAPILKYLLAYPAHAVKSYGISTSSDSYDIYFDPSASYNTGFKPGTGDGLITFDSIPIATELAIWRGMANSTPDTAPDSLEKTSARYDLAWGVPSGEVLPNNYYRYLPHALRSVDITVNGSPSLTAGAQASRAHFN